jgi:hypothetical protein
MLRVFLYGFFESYLLKNKVRIHPKPPINTSILTNTQFQKILNLCNSPILSNITKLLENGKA